jgi:hypothetical protein
MGVFHIYRDRVSLGHLPLLKGQTLIETPYRLQPDENTAALWWCEMVPSLGVAVIKDRKGANDATLGGIPIWGGGGPFESDLTFNGSSQYGSLAAKIDFTTAFTIEAVVKKAAGGSEGQVIHAAQDHFAAPNYGNAWRMAIGWEDDLNCLFYNGTGNQTVQSTTTVCDGVYHYLVARLGSNTIDLFKDGVNIGTGAVSGSVVATNYVPEIARGRNNTTTFGTYLLGSLAELRLSAVARPDAEILMNARLLGFA